MHILHVALARLAMAVCPVFALEAYVLWKIRDNLPRVYGLETAAGCLLLVCSDDVMSCTHNGNKPHGWVLACLSVGGDAPIEILRS